MTDTDGKEIKLFGDERIEPLDDRNMIIQSVSGYRFGADAVALANFAAKDIKRDARVFDLCSGCGVIGLLVAIATGARVDGAELDGALADMSNRSAELDGLGNVKFYNADIRNLDGEIFSHVHVYDAVVCNPPFFKADSKSRRIAPAANSELTVTLGDVITATDRLLKPLGAFYLVYTASRLDEALCACRNKSLTPKTLVVANNGKTFLLKCVKGGKSGLTVKTGIGE